MRISERVAALAVVVLANGCATTAAHLDRCSSDAKACFGEASALAKSLEKPQRDAEGKAIEAALGFERACREGGDVRGCEQSLGYWLSRGGAPGAVDELTGLPLKAAPRGAPAGADTHIADCWGSYEALSFNEVGPSRDAGRLQAFLDKFPHGAHRHEAQRAIALLQLASIEDRAQKNGDSDALLEFAEQHLDLAQPRAALVRLDARTLSRSQTDRILAIAATPAAQNDNAFATFAEQVRDRLAELDLEGAGNLTGEAAVNALRAWARAHPASKLLPQEKVLEADKAFEVAMQAKGEDSVKALAAFQRAYPSSSHVAPAREAEVDRASKLAIDASIPRPLWLFLDTYPAAPQTEAVHGALSMMLVQGAAGCTGADYDAFLARFPDDPARRAIAARMAVVKKAEEREAAVRAAEEHKRAIAEACGGACVARASAGCASTRDEGAAPTPRAVCISRSLRPCCVGCGLHIATATYASCE